MAATHRRARRTRHLFAQYADGFGGLLAPAGRPPRPSRQPLVTDWLHTMIATFHREVFATSALALTLVLLPGVAAAAQNKPKPQPAPSKPGAAVAPTAAPAVTPPPDYVIGIDDTLDIVFWQEKELSATVAVRPDGKISLPLLNEIHAEGLTPEQLRTSVTEAASKFVEGPTVTVVVKGINSRKVFITGQVGKPGPYPLIGATTVLQLISMAGGLSEYADAEQVRIVRTENGKTVAQRFNYKDVSKGKNLTQNILLKPGDTIVVP
jgi:polysaccharide biosynthesis/export protein